ncbi:Pectate lyase superfamily protein [compost metagenome]
MTLSVNRSFRIIPILLIAMVLGCLSPFSPASVAAEASGTGNIPNLINVKSTGAAGDGATNDTKAFITALEMAAARPGGAKVIVPQGTYLIDLEDPLYVKGNVQVIGKGAPTLKFVNFSSDPDQYGYEAFYVSGNNIAIDGIIVDGNESLIRGIGVHTGSRNIKISGCTIKNITQAENSELPQYSALISGILIYGNTQNVTVYNSTITNISAIHENPIARGILVWSEPNQPFAQNVRILKNNFSYITPREDADAIYFDKTPENTPKSNSLIQGNQIHHVGKRGIKIAAPGVTVKSNHITNSYNGNNYYLFPNSNPLPQDMFSAISVYASHVNVTGNLIDGIGSYYAAIEADLGILTNITIEKNSISNGHQANIEDTNGIRLGQIRNFIVTDNSISNMRSGIFSPIDTSQSGSISSNTISNVEYGILFVAPEISYQTSNVEVKNNTITSRQDHILSLPNLK